VEATTLNRRRSVPSSRRLLSSHSDDRLVAEAKCGSEAAFEAIYERYHRPLLSFCRHMLGSREDTEDVLQHTFSAAFRTLARTDGRIRLQPWLYTIARNRCISVIRARREQPVEEVEPVPTAGLSEEIERRSDLRDLLYDIAELPENQRAALVLSEAADLGHAEIAEVLDCEKKRVKALIFQARSSLITSRRARDVACTDIRAKLATARGSALRGATLRRHLKRCPGCAEYAEEVRRQRAMLAVVLPVAPSLGLRENALAAAGAGGVGATGGGGLLAALGASTGAKVAAAMLAVGGAAGGVVASDPQLVAKAGAAVIDTFGGGDHGRAEPGAGLGRGRPDRARSALAGASGGPTGPSGTPSGGGPSGKAGYAGPAWPGEAPRTDHRGGHGEEVPGGREAPVGAGRRARSRGGSEAAGERGGRPGGHGRSVGRPRSSGSGASGSRGGAASAARSGRSTHSGSHRGGGRSGGSNGSGGGRDGGRRRAAAHPEPRPATAHRSRCGP
jgi:RNA polymerase sigma factor (sigma-70 family)